MKNPPILISVIGFFGVMAGLFWLVLGLRILGFDWFGALGDLGRFEQSGLWGWLAIGAGIAWLAASFGLWSLQPGMAVHMHAGFALFEAFLWFLEYPGTGVGFAAAIMPVIILLYMNSREVKAAFGQTDASV